VEGNKEGDAGARTTAIADRIMLQPSLVTPGDIRQAYHLYGKALHYGWNRNSRRGLMYLHTVRGLMKGWVSHIGRVPDTFWNCGATHNVAHLIMPGYVGGSRRSWEEIWLDPEF